MLSIGPGIEYHSPALLIPHGSSPLLGAPFPYCLDRRLNVANAQDTSDMFAWVSRPGMPPEEWTCFCHRHFPSTHNEFVTYLALDNREM